MSNNNFPSTGQNLVPKSSRESETSTRGGDRETQNGAIFPPPPPLIPAPRAAAVLPPPPPHGGRETAGPHGLTASAPLHGTTTCVGFRVTQHSNDQSTMNLNNFASEKFMFEKRIFS